MRRMLCLGYIMLVFSGKDTFIQAHFVRLKDNKFETRPALMGYCYKKKKKDLLHGFGHFNTPYNHYINME